MPQTFAPNPPRDGVAFVDRNGALTPAGYTMLNQLWRQIVAGFVTIPVTITGTNVLTMTPVLHREGATTYVDNLGFSGVIANNSTGTVTGLVASADTTLDTLKVYKANGLTQCGSGDLLAGEFYVFYYVAALDGGAGGFVKK